jgi:hypothetical protein
VVIKTWKDKALIFDLAETFDNMKKIKVEPWEVYIRCALRKITRVYDPRREIDPNPKKESASMKIKPPESFHDVQKLTGCMTALSRFISWLGVRGFPFFKLLKNQDKFQWTQETQKTFEDLKKYLTTPTRPGGPRTPWKLVALHIGYKQCG